VLTAAAVAGCSAVEGAWLVNDDVSAVCALVQLSLIRSPAAAAAALLHAV